MIPIPLQDNSHRDVRKATITRRIDQNAGYAMEFNGTDEYLTRALPTNLLTGTTSDFTSAGTRPTGWGTGSGETWNQTGITGSTSTNVLKLSGTNAYAVYGGLTAGKKYKIRVRWYGDNSLRIGSTSTGAEYYTSASTTQWNRKEITLVATSANLYFSIASGTVYIDFFNFTEDWKLDLNESHELIKHSMNRDFEQTLGAELIVNGNLTSNTGSWTATNADLSLVTGNGFTGNALRAQATVANSINIYPTGATLTSGSQYIVKFKHRCSKAGGLVLRANNDNANITYVSVINGNRDQNITSNPTVYEAVILCTTTGAFSIGYTSGGTIIGDYIELDEVSVREIPSLVTNGSLTDPVTEWTSGSGCIISGGMANISNINVSGSAGFCYRNLGGSVISRNLRLTYEIKNYNTGSLRINAGGSGYDLPNSNSNGIKTFDFKQSTNSSGFFGFRLENGQSFSGSLDNIHIYELPDYTSAGNHSFTYSISDKYAGTGSLKITASGAGSSGSNYVSLPAAQIDTLVSGNKYTLEGFARSDTAGRTITARIGTKEVTSATLSTTAGTFTKFVLNFLWEDADASIGQDLKMYLNGAGNVYVDSMSLTQRYDRAIALSKKSSVSGYSAIINDGANGTATSGFIIALNSANKVELKDYQGYVGTSPSNAGINDVDLTSTISYTDWENVLYVINSAGGYARLYENGLLAVTDSTYDFGKQIARYPLTIGKDTTVNASYFNGVIGKIQILRFTNIGQSNFNPSTYKIGQSVTGGGAEEVLLLDFGKDKTSMTNILKDWSGTGNNVTGVNVDSSNVIRKI